MAKRHELQLKRHAASEGIAELRGEETDNRLHAGDAIQTRPERPGFLRLMRLFGGTIPARPRGSLTSPGYPLHMPHT